MHLRLNEEQLSLQRATRAYLSKHCPLSSTRALIDDPQGFNTMVWEKAAVEQGWTSILVPSGMGGVGGTFVELMVLAEELGRVAYSGPFLATNLVIAAIIRWGSREQIAEVLPQLMSGSATASWCGLDSGGGWGRSTECSIATPAAGGFRINGRKVFVPHGGSARYLLVAANVDGRSCHFVVPSSAMGVVRGAMATVDVSRRFDWVQFDDVLVPLSSMVEADDETYGHLLNLAAIMICADSIGGASVMLERTIQYSHDRSVFGAPIGSYQAIKHKAADMFVWLECARVATLAAAQALTEGREDVDEATSIAKSYAGETLSRFMLESLQIHGGVGYTWEHDLHFYFKRIKAAESLFGDVVWHRERLAQIIERSG